MTKNLMAVLAVALVLLLAGLAWQGWRSRKARQEATFESPTEALEFFGEELARATGFYVATSFANDFLERINAYGLGARGAAEIIVFTEGLLVIRQGERPLAIDKAQMSKVMTTQYVIDKAVEAEGIISIAWVQINSQLATHLRVVNQDSRNNVINALKSICSREEVK